MLISHMAASGRTESVTTSGLVSRSRQRWLVHPEYAAKYLILLFLAHLQADNRVEMT